MEGVSCAHAATPMRAERRRAAAPWNKLNIAELEIESGRCIRIISIEQSERNGRVIHTLFVTYDDWQEFLAIRF
jgi:hypothetical protein